MGSRSPVSPACLADAEFNQPSSAPPAQVAVAQPMETIRHRHHSGVLRSGCSQLVTNGGRRSVCLHPTNAKKTGGSLGFLPLGGCRLESPCAPLIVGTRGGRGPFGGGGRGGYSAGTMSMKPIIISCQVWSPQVTSRLGSGLWGLPAELSKWAVHSMTVPFGRRRGCFRP